LEVDAIVQKRNGDYAAFEIKLGVGYIDEAAESLKKNCKKHRLDQDGCTKIIKYNYWYWNEPSTTRWYKCNFISFVGKLTEMYKVL